VHCGNTNIISGIFADYQTTHNKVI